MILGQLVPSTGVVLHRNPRHPVPQSNPRLPLQLHPSAPRGSGDLTLNITGSNFDGEDVIQTRAVWSANGNDTLLTRTVDCSSQISAVVPAVFLSSPVTAHVWVEAFDQIEPIVWSVGNTGNATSLAILDTFS
jgi:hypothetical protein